VGVKVAAASGFALIAGGLALGATTTVDSSGVFVAAWMAILGAGMGIAMATSSSSALSELPEERSGIGSAVLQAVNKTGGPLGTAILGSVLSSAYVASVAVAGLPAPAAHAVRESVFGGVLVAERTHSTALLESVHAAFVHGMDASLIVSAGIAAIGVLLAILFLPSRPSMAAQLRPSGKPKDIVVTT
jgi:hypothetical protein